MTMLPESADVASATGRSDAVVLIVEDEIIARVLLAEELRELGYAVIQAASGDEALSIARSSLRVDFVLTDMQMPGAVDGCALVRALRTEFPFMKIVMLSAESPDEETRSMLDGHFVKPMVDARCIAECFDTPRAARLN